MPKTARDEPSVAEVQFGDEPSAKKVKDAVSEGDAHPDRHPLKNLARGKSVLELCTYRGARARGRRFAIARSNTRRPSARDRSSRRRRPPRRTSRDPPRPDAFPTLSVPPRPPRPSSSSSGDFEPASLQPSKTGEEKTLEYRIAFSHKNSTISPWHDIPYRASPTTYHMMCEIPKWTRAKFEIATKEPGNPIKQDEKKGVLREYKHGDMLFNYGFMPQTWEDPAHVSEDTGFKGDDDPLDMVEIGCRQMKCGQVAEVKVLGVLAMIDDGETDWKVFCIRCDDPLADRIHDVEDVDRELPGLIDTMREWFREYKVAEGKPLNAFALDEKCMDREYTEKIIEETHESWKKSEAALRAISKTAPEDAAAEVSPAAPATAEKTKR